MKKKIYIGTAYTHANKDYLDFIEDLKNLLKKDYQILDYLVAVNYSEEEIYKYDIGFVKDCDIFLAECSYPSIGLGFELATAIKERKKIFAFANKKLKVTKFIKGIKEVNYSYFEYEKIDDILNRLKANNY